MLLEPGDLSKYEYIRLKDRERWGALVPRKCPLAEKDSVRAEDLIGHRVFMPKRAQAQGGVAWFGDLYEKLDVFVSYNLLYNAAMLVDCGIGAALTIEGAAELYKNPNTVFRPFSPQLSVSSVLVWKKYQPMTPAAAAFIEHLKKTAAQY